MSKYRSQLHVELHIFVVNYRTLGLGERVCDLYMERGEGGVRPVSSAVPARKRGDDMILIYVCIYIYIYRSIDS